jgi:hypothetical protein
MVWDMHYMPLTNINRQGVTIKYQIEYTDKDEAINSNFTNLYQRTAEDLSKAMEMAYDLKARGKFNIGIYYLVEDGQGCILEDSCSCIEQIKSTSDQHKISLMAETIERQERELAAYREFIKIHHAEEIYKQFNVKPITA